jgi:hypothetical protein
MIGLGLNSGMCGERTATICLTICCGRTSP